MIRDGIDWIGWILRSDFHDYGAVLEVLMEKDLASVSGCRPRGSVA
jgi:hypothetical protein